MEHYLEIKIWCCFLKEGKMGCKKSYSKEHSYIPYGKNKIKCVLCGYVKDLKKPRIKELKDLIKK